MGYHLAGFEVVGVDIRPQPHYPFRFVQADAMTFPLDGFDAIHASPPCQRYSRLRKSSRAGYPDLLGPTRDRLLAEARVPWVIENVPGSPIRAALLLCGSMFGLRVMRHRYFEASWILPFPPFACNHGAGPWLNMYTSGDRRNCTERGYLDAMGVPWASTEGGSECIPPAYTDWIGAHLALVLSELR